MVIGIYVPFLPAWFEGRGLSPGQVAMILAVAMWAQFPVGLMVASLSEKSGHRKGVIVLISAMVFIGLMAFQVFEGYVALLLGWLMIGTLLTSSIPLIDSMATLPVNVSRFEYGQVRRWGSVGFIVASTLGGIYLHGRHTESILTLLTIAAALMLMAAILLPNQRSLPRQSHRSATMDLLANKRFVILLITAAMLQSSHAGLYGFATIHWLDAEISERTVGLLWAEGVLAEVLFFSQGRRILKWFPIHRILLIAAIAGLVRWSVLGMTTNLAFLIMVQTLHALTFAGTHLATVSYISKNIDSSHSATAQGLYSGLAMGLVFGLAMILAGKAYMTHEGYVFLVMLIFSVLGGVGAMSLWKMDSKC